MKRNLTRKFKFKNLGKYCHEAIEVIDDVISRRHTTRHICKVYHTPEREDDVK